MTTIGGGVLTAPTLFKLGFLPLGAGTAFAAGNNLAGILLGIVGVGTFAVLIVTNSRKNTRDYNREIREAEERGEKRAEERLTPWLDYWRQMYFAQRGGDTGQSTQPPLEGPRP